MSYDDDDSWPSLPPHNELRYAMMEHRLNHGKRPYDPGNYPDFERAMQYFYRRIEEPDSDDEPFLFEEDRPGPFPILQLPAGVLGGILGAYFTPQERLQARLVCRKFKEEAERWQYWRNDIKRLWCGGAFLPTEHIKHYRGVNQEFRVWVQATMHCSRPAEELLERLHQRADSAVRARRADVDDPAPPEVCFEVWQLYVMALCSVFRLLIVEAMAGNEWAQAEFANIAGRVAVRAREEGLPWHDGYFSMYIDACFSDDQAGQDPLVFSLYVHLGPSGPSTALSIGSIAGGNKIWRNIIEWYRCCITDPTIYEKCMCAIPQYHEVHRWHWPTREAREEEEQLSHAIAMVYEMEEGGG